MAEVRILRTQRQCQPVTFSSDGYFSKDHADHV